MVLRCLPEQGEDPDQCQGLPLRHLFGELQLLEARYVLGAAGDVVLDFRAHLGAALVSLDPRQLQDHSLRVPDQTLHELLTLQDLAHGFVWDAGQLLMLLPL